MKTLSVKQPWAAALVYGVKLIEIRTWHTKYRGPLLIHASKEYDYVGEKALASFMPMLKKHGVHQGGIIGQVELVLVKPYMTIQDWIGDLKRHRCPVGWYQPPSKKTAMYGWLIDKPQPLQFTAVDGQLGLWDYAFRGA